MRGVQAKALALDSLRQVLDNKVFRIMVALAALPPLFTFLVAFRPEEVVVLFGWKRWPYADIGLTRGVDDPRAFLIERFLSLVFDQAGGLLGVLVCLVATAFFVPQMIEKGAADVLFHKPLSRLTLYVSRYFAGLLFVALLACLMAFGTWAGLTVMSGYNDPGILIGAFTLTYVFGLLYAVSMLFGILTRSPIAAVLCTVIFLFVNGCIVHPSWTFKEYWRDTEWAKLSEEASGAALDPLDTLDPALRAAAVVSDVLHYTLPKTADGRLIARELRRVTSSLPYHDSDTGVRFFRLPDGAERVEPSAVPVSAVVESFLGPPRFALRFPAERASLSLHRRERSRDVEGGESSRDAAKELERRLADAGPERSSGTVGGSGALAASVVRWTEGAQSSSAILFGTGDWIYALNLVAPADLELEQRDSLQTRIDASFGQDADPTAAVYPWTPWYERRAGFDAPWKFNLGFSIATSLAFVAMVLGLGWWRLSRMDF